MIEVENTTATGSGNGVATVFSFSPITIYNEDELEVVVTDPDGNTTTIAKGASSTTYSISVSSYPGTGSITYPAVGGTPLATGYTITIRRVMEFTQGVNLTNQGGYFAETQETMHDQHVARALQLREELERSVKVPLGSPIDPNDLIADLEAAAAEATAAAALVEAALDDLNLIQATTDDLGVVELALDSEAQAMTDTVRAIVPANLAAVASDNSTALTGTSTTRFLTPASGRFANRDAIVIPVTSEAGVVSTGTAKVTFRMPYAFTLTAVRASLTTAQASGSTFTVDINESGSTILSTKLTIDNTEKTSTTAATAAVISDTALADDAEMTIDVDQIGNGSAAGLKVTLIGYRA